MVPCDIINVYLSGRIDDYAVSAAYPNLHIVFESGHKTYYPIYSTGMYEVFERHFADSGLYQKVDKLYDDFVSNVSKQSGELYESVSRDIAGEYNKVQKFRSRHAVLK